MSRHLKLFVFGAFAFWAAVALPAYRLGGSAAFVYSLVALALCAVPTAALVYWTAQGGRRSPEETLLLVLGGSGLRMGVVLGAGLMLHLTLPYFQRVSFWLWLLVFYLYVLALEVYLVLTEQRQSTS